MEDWNDILKEFKECMSRNNHAGVLSGYEYDEPIEPTSAIRRLNGNSANRPKSTDKRDLADYVKAVKVWTASCAAVLGSLLNIFTTEVMGRLEATDLNLVTASRNNITQNFDWVNREYGGWSDARGTRNYDEMKAIPNFTSFESTNNGFKKLRLLTEERNGWNNIAQRYEDGFYRNWLLLRMEDWPKLEFERNIIIGTPAMTFATAKERVLIVIESIRDKS